MGLKMGGFVCDKCNTFERYNNSYDVINKIFKLPKNWKLFDGYDLIINKNNMQLYIYDANLLFTILCDKCSIIHERKIKINKIINERR